MKLRSKAGRGAVLATAVLLSTGCGSVLETNRVRLRFEGTVTSAADGQPLPGAVVALEQVLFVTQTAVASDTTDHNGHYSIEYEAICDPGSDLYAASGAAHLLVASADGYDRVSSVNIDERLQCVSIVQTVNFTLTLTAD